MRSGAIALVLLAGCDLSTPVPFVWDAGLTCAPEFDLEELLVDQRCRPQRCTARIEQNNCTAIIRLEPCPLLDLVGDIHSGSFESDELKCNRVATSPDALLSLSCLSVADRELCRIDFYRPSMPVIDLPMQSVQITPLAPVVKPEGVISSFEVFLGKISSMALTSDHLVIAWPPRLYIDPGGDPAPVPSELVFVDLDSATVSSTISGPNDLHRIAPAPGGDGFYGVYGIRDLRLARFDSRGRMVSSVSATITPPANPLLFNTAITFDDQRVFTVFTDVHDEPFEGTIVSFDRDDLSFSNRTGNLRHRLRAARPIDNDLLAVSDAGYSTFLFFGRSTLIADSSYFLSSFHHTEDGPGFILSYDANLILLSAGTFGHGELWWIDPPEEQIAQLIDSSIYFPVDAGMWASIRDSQGLVWLGITRRLPPFVATLVRVDPIGRRFLLGEAALGQGPVSDLVRDSRGKVWAMLPWEGRVVRLELP